MNTSDEQLFEPRSKQKYTQAYELYTSKNKKGSGALSGQKLISRPSELHQYYVKDEYFRKWIKNESVNRAYKSTSIFYESFDRLPTWHSFWFSSWPKIKSDLEQIWCGGSADSESCQVFLGSFSKAEFHRSHDDSRLSFLRDEALIPGQYPEVAVIMRDFNDWEASRNLIIRPETNHQENLLKKNYPKNLEFYFFH